MRLSSSNAVIPHSVPGLVYGNVRVASWRVRTHAIHHRVHVRLADPDDAEAIAEIDPEYTVDKAREEISRDVSRVHVAIESDDATDTRAGLVVGWLAAWHVPPHELQIIQITVSPVKRRRGIGRLLLRTALDAYVSSVDQTVLEVREDNTAALGLYEWAGFERAGPVRKNYYRDGCGAVCMIKR